MQHATTKDTSAVAQQSRRLYECSGTVTEGAPLGIAWWESRVRSRRMAVGRTSRSFQVEVLVSGCGHSLITCSGLTSSKTMRREAVSCSDVLRESRMQSPWSRACSTSCLYQACCGPDHCA